MSLLRRYGAFATDRFCFEHMPALEHSLTVFKGLMDAEERHNFDGEGFAYLKNPIWWAGILSCTIASTYLHWVLLMLFSNHRGSRKLCSLRICSCNSRHAFGLSKCLNRCCAGVIFLEGTARDVREVGMRNMPHRLSHDRSSCSAGQRDPNDR